MDSKMTCDSSAMWGKEMPEGLDLEISHHPFTMKRVVNLVIAMERLKGGRAESVISTDFRDEHLLSMMLEEIVEERIVFETRSAPSAQLISEHQCGVTDSQKRSLVLVKNSMELHAVMLQGGSDNRKVQLNMSTYANPTPSADARPIALGIKDTNLYLSCHMDGSKPTLHLEAVEDKGSLSRIATGSEMERFLFYKRDTGLNISTLMSAHYPNWYISTATQDNKPVEMCQETANRYRTFSFQRQN